MNVRYFFIGLVAAALAIGSCRGNSSGGNGDPGQDGGAGSGGGSTTAGAGGSTGNGGSGGTAGEAGAGGGGTSGAGGSTAGAGGSDIAGAGGNAGSAGGSAGTGAGGQSGAGGGNNCAVDCSMRGLTCCGNKCVNTGNDVTNCGSCGNRCTGDFPYCDRGSCGSPACDSGITCSAQEQCCGRECCAPGMLCCVIPGGPVVFEPRCVSPQNGSCPAGCPSCP